VKRLALLTLLLASSSLVAAPAPLPKPQRKAERLAPAQQQGAPVPDEGIAERIRFVMLAMAAAQPVLPPPGQAPALPKNADPPG
jgi:hypothetical protein